MLLRPDLDRDADRERRPDFADPVEERRREGIGLRHARPLERQRHRDLDDADALEHRRDHQKERANHVAADRDPQRGWGVERLQRHPDHTDTEQIHAYRRREGRQQSARRHRRRQRLRDCRRDPARQPPLRPRRDHPPTHDPESDPAAGQHHGRQRQRRNQHRQRNRAGQ